jgi:hypothetical protein
VAAIRLEDSSMTMSFGIMVGFIAVEFPGFSGQ